jgi:3-deoxy-D-manno-octulosonic acid (KDO) 8-phosphate synthase
LAIEVPCKIALFLIPHIFKASYRKANRSRSDSFTGIGDEAALEILRKVRRTFDVPVVLDVTHSLQQPNQQSGVTGGKPALIETLAKAGIAVGVDGLFLETHPYPA